MLIARFMERVYQDRDGREEQARSDTADMEVSNRNYDPELGADLYSRYLDEQVYAEEVGFDGIMLNEHHNAPFCMGSQPNIEAAILARITKRVKIIMLGNVLPLWDDPVLLAEQLAEIDVISRGRLVNGWVRGTGRESVAHTAQAPYNWERFQEAHELVIKTWSEPGPFRWEGQHFHYRTVNPWVRPYQRPHPPIWQSGVISRNTLEWAAKRRYPYIMIATDRELSKQAFDYYSEVAEREGFAAGPQHFGYMIKVHVEDTYDRAYEVGKNYLSGRNNPFIEGNEGRVKGFLQNLPGMVDRARLLPTVGAQSAGRSVASAGSLAATSAEERRRARQRAGYDEQIARGAIIVGSPRTVIERIKKEMELIRPGQLLFWDGEGDMTHEQSMRSMKLMGEEVIPALKEYANELELPSAFEVSPVTNEPIEEAAAATV